jgi:hypothetical protein
LDEPDMIDQEFARRFAQEWIEAWNSHDLGRVLAHYADDFEMSSPLIPAIAGEPSGRLRGKEAVRAYWEKGLQLLPDLHFELRSFLLGVGSVVLTYQGHRGLVAEEFRFSPDGKVVRAAAHYSL